MRIGIDLGGTKIEIAALSPVGHELFSHRIDAPRDDYDATIQAITGLIGCAEQAAGQTGTIGIGTPGATSPSTGLLRNSNSTWLNGRALKSDIETAIGRPVRLENDANCFALSEALDGAGAGSRVVFGVIVGTGTGAGIVVDGRVLSGPNAIAGEWGHNPLPWPRHGERPGEACYCGKTGCIETFLSGPGLARDHEKATALSIDAAEISRRSAAGEAAALATLARYTDRMARALAHVINILDPDLIVLGGGLSRIQSLYDDVPRLWGRYVFSDRVDTRLVPPVHGDAGGVRGAAWLWPDVDPV